MNDSLARGAAVLVCAVSTAACQPDARMENPVEIGRVAWGRDYDAARVAAKSTGKPIFLLFQEVPGCAGCKQFGQEVLSDAGVVKMIEGNFIPLLVHNNKPGRDAEILKRFDEPAWNYQVVRFLDADGCDLIPRKDKVWEGPELLQRMKQALEKSGPPKNPKTNVQRVAIAQPCFWTGEMTLGGMDGVMRTEAGFLDGNEVTLVDYDPGKISLSDLTTKARAAGVSTKVSPSFQGYRRAPASDQKRQLQGTPYAALDLTPEQATKVNAFARTAPRKADGYLTDAQRVILKR